MSGRTQPVAARTPTADGAWLIGNLLDIRRDPLQFLLTTAERHGSVARYFVGNYPLYLVSSPAGIEHVLVRNSRNYSIYIGGRKALRLVLGDGLFVAEGSGWRDRRRLMQPLFRPDAISTFSARMVTAARTTAQRWEEAAAPGDIIPVEREMSRLTLEIAASTFFTADLHGRAGEIADAVTTLVEVLAGWMRSGAILVAPNELLRLHPPFRRALKTLDDIVRGLVADRRQTADPPDDLLTQLLLARDPESGIVLTDEQVRDEVMTLLLSGHETTALALTWTWYLLALHPAARTRLEEELSAALGDDDPDVAALDRMPYLQQVIQESLRLFPPLWTTFRVALEADEIDGHAIPAGSRVTISPYVTHRLATYWSAPGQFDPDRFAPGAENEHPRFAYLPFGAGPRQCLGNHFAMLETRLVIAVLARRFHLDLPPNQVVAPEALLTLRPRNGLHMVVTSR